jgi:hypothetical protein
MPIKKAKLPLTKTHPKLAKEAYGWDPKSVSSGTHQKKKWKCSKGHIWQAAVYSRKKSGCPFCSGRKSISGKNDLKTLFPKLAKELVNDNPKLLKKSSQKKVEWKCNKNHLFKARVSDRTRGKGCPICAGRKILEGFNDLATTHPLLAEQANGWDPKKITYGNGTFRNWKCKKNHKWRAKPNNRSVSFNEIGIAACPFCSGMKILEGFNDLSSTHPEIAKEAYGWNPSKKAPGTKQKMRWKCKLGHIYVAQIGNRTSRGDGCSYCSNSKVLKGFNDLKTIHPTIAKQALGWDPSKYVSGANKKMKWKCEQGHIWQTMISARTQGNGCPECAEYGFNVGKSAWLYLLDHSKWKMFQIGITNNLDHRVKTHKKLGWQLIEVRGPMDGHLTQQWETAILRMLRTKGADLSNKEIAGKFDGYSEAWSKSTFPARSIKELMRLTEEFEQSNK